MATDRLINKDQGDDIIDALSDIATNINTITYGPQTSADKVVAMTGYAKAETVAAISQGDTLNEAVGKLEKKADDNATAITGKTAGPESATVGDIATFNNVNGKVLNDSGISIQTSVDDTKDTEVPTSKAVGTFVSGKGYATGVATSTANHLVTFNGTDGKALKDGGATIAFNTTGVLDDDTAVPTSKAVQSYVTGKHYAGSSSDGGAATSADKLNIGNSNIGSATQPVYFDKTTGKPVAITNTIQSNVPADAVFTDTTYTVATGTQNGKIKVTPSVGSAYEVPVYGLGNAAYKGVADTVSSSTDLVTSNAVNTKLASYVPNSDFVVAENNIMYSIDTGVKNQFPTNGMTPGSSVTDHGVTLTYNENGTFTLNGTATGGAATFILADIPASQNDGNVFKNCILIGGYSSSVYIAVDEWNATVKNRSYDNTTPVDISMAANLRVAVFIRVNGSTQTQNTIIHPFICDKTVYTSDSTFAKPALSNADLTILEAGDRAELVELVDSGAKNLWNPSKVQSSSTSNGITFTLSSDGVLTCNGTATGGDAVYAYIGDGADKASKILYIEGTTDSGLSSWFFDIYDEGWTNRQVCYSGTKVVYVESKSTTWIWRVIIPVGATCDNLKLYPMVCTKAAFGVSSKFVPYRPNWDLVCSNISTLSHRITEFATTGTQTRSFILKRLYGTSNTRCPLQLVYASQDPTSTPVVLYTELFMAGETNNTPTLSRSAMCFSAGMVNQSNPIPQPYPAVWFKPDTTKQWLYITVNFGYSNLWAAGYFKIENSNDQIMIDTTNGIDISSDSSATQMTIYHPTFTS